ncbi:MAG: large conductance mechanosensitive channel protein MscL [Clostridia bacterium]|nr:large conductance mechanosensitive channel protein MscL [Clostridia bacterium]
MKKFFGEFKKFITRGNVIDMAVGVTVGAAFTAIVNGMTNYILKPIINFFIALIIGADSLSEMYTFLGEIAYDENGKIDLENCIYIDWGSFISAVINFFIIAFVLFCIVKAINNMKEGNNAKADAKRAKKAERAELKAAGIKCSDKAAVEAFRKEKAEKAAAEKAAADAKAAEEARIAQENSTEALLKDIRDLLKSKA